MDAFGSDRKLSELGLDIPDFLNPVIDPAELFPTVHDTEPAVDTFTDRHSHCVSHRHQQIPQVGPNENHQHQLHHHYHHHQQEVTSTPKVTLSVTPRTSKMTAISKSDDEAHSRYNLRHCPADIRSDVEDEYEDEFKLIDVDDEVVLDSGWLDKIFDVDSRAGHVTCIEDDAIGSQHVSDEHSYSLANGTSDLEFSIKMEANEIDMDTGIFEMINPDLTLISNSDMTSSIGSCSEEYGIVSSADAGTAANGCGIDVMGCHIIKTEPLEAPSGSDSVFPFSPVQSALYDVSDTVDLPLTPPSTSSSSSSDSEAGGLSPRRSPPSSPYHVITSPPPSRTHHMTSSGVTHHHSHSYHSHNHHDQNGSQHSVWTASLSTNQQPLFSNPLPSSGILILSEEEKRTLIAEGYPVPSKLPLTKQEEKNLKKIRRKIKNKISAQESRRKKKEYLETLEKKVETVSIENINLRKKLDLLESNNRSLVSQLQKLQSLHKVSSSNACVAVN